MILWEYTLYWVTICAILSVRMTNIESDNMECGFYPCNTVVILLFLLPNSVGMIKTYRHLHIPITMRQVRFGAGLSNDARSDSRYETLRSN